MVDGDRDWHSCRRSVSRWPGLVGTGLPFLSIAKSLMIALASAVPNKVGCVTFVIRSASVNESVVPKCRNRWSCQPACPGRRGDAELQPGQNRVDRDIERAAIGAEASFGRRLWRRRRRTGSTICTAATGATQSIFSASVTAGEKRREIDLNARQDIRGIARVVNLRGKADQSRGAPDGVAVDTATR